MKSANRGECVTRGVNRMVCHDTILILIPSDTIFANTSKIIRYNFNSIQEYIDIDIMIIYLF